MLAGHNAIDCISAAGLCRSVSAEQFREAMRGLRTVMPPADLAQLIVEGEAAVRGVRCGH